MDPTTKQVLIDELFKVYYTAKDFKARIKGANKRHYAALNMVDLILEQARDDKG